MPVAVKSEAIKEDAESEEPTLEFNDYAVAFHFAVEWTDERVPVASASRATDRARGEPQVEPMESYERDLLLYAHRDNPPFETRVVPVPDAMATLTVRCPPELMYESEQRRVRLKTDATDGRRRTFSVVTSETIFKRSRIVVLSLVFRPSVAAAEESQLNEFDLIKLIKLWEGGEGRSALEWEREILFETASGEAKTLTAIVCELFGEWLPQTDSPSARSWSAKRLQRRRRRSAQSGSLLAYRVGTVELYVPTTDWGNELFVDIAALKEGSYSANEEEQRARWDRAVAVGGLVQGLLDFRAITRTELEDVFAEVEIDPEDKSLDGFHKGTLLSLSAEDEAASDDERESPIGVDPYLALPNVVLLHNEQRLKAARWEEQRLSAGQPGRSGPEAKRVDIDDTANGLDEITGLLAQHLPNIFHYANERRLYETGAHSRGFDDLETLVRRRREELTSILQRRERRRDRWTAIAALVSAVVVAVVAAVQNLFVQEVVETLDWRIILVLAGFLYLMFFQLRNRLF